MLTPPASVRIFAAREAVDFRKGFDGLCGIVRDGFGDDPFSGQFFLFFNRRRDRVKLLVWDRNGFWLFTKRLERGTFERIETGEGRRVEIDRAQLSMLLEGIDARRAKFRRHFARDVRINARDFGDDDRSARVAR